MGSYRRLFGYAMRYGRSWALILLVSVLCTAFGLLQAWPMKVLVDHVLGRAPMSQVLSRFLAPLPGTGSPEGLLVWVVLAGLAVFAVNGAVDGYLTCTWVRVGQRMVYDLASDLFGHIQRRSLLFHGRNPVGDSISRITGDCWCVHTVVDNLLFKPKLALISALAMIGLMMQMDLGLTLLSLAAAPFMVGSSWLVGRPVRAAARTRCEIESAIQSHVQRTLSGIAVVQAFGREDEEQRRFRALTGVAIRTQCWSTLLGSLHGLSTGLATALATVAILWVGSHRVLEGRLTLGSIFVFLSYLGLLQGQLRAFTGLYSSLQGAAASMERVLEVLETEHEVTDPPCALALPRVRGHLRLEHVHFGYEPNRSVLHDLCLDVPPGQTLAIVGPTGSGKSTLVGLVPRFFDPWQGRVTLDGLDLRSLRLRDLRAQVAIVLQEPFLFPCSVAENIAFGRPGATRAAVEAAADAAGAAAFIRRLPRGYDTVLGERGGTLSGGERQRLAIARALLIDAPVLILDEPTSALDGQTEEELMAALARLMAGRTTLIVAHRLSTIRRADRIVVLRDGRLVENETDREGLDCQGNGSDSALIPTGECSSSSGAGR
jgi:ATP-binding cassette subfamily B protein